MISAKSAWKWLAVRPALAAIAIALAGAAITAGLLGWQARQDAQLAESVFLRHSDRLVEALRLRIAGYEHGLRGLRGIFVVKPDARAADFAAYAATRDLPVEFPGAIGMGFVRHVPHREIETFARRRRLEAGADDTVRHRGGNPGNAMLVDYFSPASLGNRAIGFDLGADPARREAAMRSMWTGEAALSPPLALADLGRQGNGLAFLLPIYRAGLPVETPGQRTEAIFGWSMMVLDAAAMLTGIADEQIDFKIYDVVIDEEPRLIFDGARSLPVSANERRGLSSRYELPFGKRSWRLDITPRPGFVKQDESISPLIAVGGGVASLLAALVAYLLLTTRQHAVALAEKMTGQLRFNEAREHDFSQSSADWQWETDARHRFIHFSDNFLATYCLTTGQVQGKTRHDLLMQGGMHAIEEIEAHQASLDAHRAFRNFEYRIRGNDGVIRWISVSGVPYCDAHGTFAGYRGAGANVTARKEAETALIHARNEAERANRAKSDFLSSMSHELRTPMNAIIGFAQMLEYDTTLDADQQDNVHEILKAGRHLLDLINEVLDLARIESGRIELSLEPVDIAALAEECRHLIQPLAAARKIHLKLDIPPGAAVRADRVRLKQVLLNLLSNAVKYNRDAGRIDLGTAPAAPGHLRIIVADTGIGIAPARLDEVFEPFNRLDAECGEQEGTGIGLTITRRIVETMGGTVAVASEIGVGSRFWIDLPSAITTSPGTTGNESTVAGETASGPAANDDAAQYTVLYIEDNPANIKLVQHIFRRLPHLHLMTGHTPEIGIELALAHRPDLILLDINLPGMNGYQVLDILKANARLKNTPVIAVTANAMPRDIERGRAAGFADYLTKPLDIGPFIETIKHCLDNGKEHTA